MKESSKSRIKSKNYITSNRCSATLLSCAAPWRRPLRRTGIGSCLQLCCMERDYDSRRQIGNNTRNCHLQQAKHSSTNCHVIPFKPWQRQLSMNSPVLSGQIMLSDAYTPSWQRLRLQNGVCLAQNRFERFTSNFSVAQTQNGKLWQGHCFKH